MNNEYLTCIGVLAEDKSVRLPDGDLYSKVLGFRILDPITLSDFSVDLNTAKRFVKEHYVIRSHVGRYYENDVYVNEAKNKLIYIGKGNTPNKEVDLAKLPILNSRSISVYRNKTDHKIRIKLGELTKHRSLYLVYELNTKLHQYAISNNGNALYLISNLDRLSTNAYESYLNSEMSIDDMNKLLGLNIRARDWYCKVGDLVTCDLRETLGSFKVDKLFTKFICRSTKKAFDLLIFPPNIKYIIFNTKVSLSGMEIKISPSTDSRAIVKIGKSVITLAEFVNRAKEFGCMVNFY